MPVFLSWNLLNFLLLITPKNNGSSNLGSLQHRAMTISSPPFVTKMASPRSAASVRKNPTACAGRFRKKSSVQVLGAPPENYPAIRALFPSVGPGEPPIVVPVHKKDRPPGAGTVNTMKLSLSKWVVGLGPPEEHS